MRTVSYAFRPAFVANEIAMSGMISACGGRKVMAGVPRKWPTDSTWQATTPKSAPVLFRRDKRMPDPEP